MKVARRLRHEIDLWGVRWQEVETFVDRISGAADQDAPARRLVEALLVVAGVVERARAPFEERPLGAPVVADLPTTRSDGGDGTESIPDPWDPEDRQARLPGLDDLELAAGPVSAVDQSGAPIEDDLTEVRLIGSATVPVLIDAAVGTVTLGPMPSYAPEVTGGQSSVVGPMGVWADVTDDLAGLFSVERRITATMGTAPDEEQVRTWGELAADRRGAAGSSTKIPADAPTVAGRAAVLAAEATAVVDALRAGAMTAQVAGAALADLTAAPAIQGGGGTADAAALEAAAQLLEDEGVDDAALPDDVRALAAAFRSTPAVQQSLVQAITALAGSPTSSSLQDVLLTRARQLGVTSSSARLLASRVEDGPLRAALDAAVAGRLHYPDGGLRMVRTLESAFAVAWPARVRWFITRRDLVLAPLFARFQQPFYSSLRALVEGGDTGLLALGLTVGPTTSVGATQVVTGEPASLVSVLKDIEPGQVGVIEGPRPTAVTVLGLDVAQGQLALQVAPLRVATVPGGPGVPGLVEAGAEIRADAPGLARSALRTGQPERGPETAGVLTETLALWSQCCAVFGRGGVAAAVVVPDPDGAPLEQVVLHGTVPARATTLVLAGLPATAWDRSDPEAPKPTVVRAGEALLLRGTTTPDDGGPDQVVQAVVEVDSVERTTGSMLAAMDPSTTGLLSTSAAPVTDEGAPAFRCGPEEDVVIITLRRSTMDVELAAPVSLRRDFSGFDVISLATRRLLPPEIFGGASATPGVDRSREFGYAGDVLTGWLRYALHG